MTKAVIQKFIYQTLFGLVLAIIYMQFRPYEQYTLAWPCAFLASYFLLWAWIAYLRLDNLSFFKTTDMYKKRKETDEANAQRNRFSNFSIFNYVNTPIQVDPSFTKVEQFKIRLFSNGLCFIFFAILGFIFSI